MDKCIIFVRVSTDRQDFSEQEINVSELAVKDGYPPDCQILIAYKESAIKLSEEARLGLSELKERILSDSSIKAVYAAEISRIARSKKVLFSIEDFLVEHHIQLVILTPWIHLLRSDGTVDDGAEMAFTIWAQYAESEMRLKKERFRQARARNNKLGKFNGGNIPLGFTLDQENKIIADPATSSVVAELFRKYLEGWSVVYLRDWLKTLGIKYSAQNIKNMLTRESYVKIIGEVAWKEVQEERAKRIKEYKGEDKKRKYSLGEKLLRCPVCGRFYTLRSGHNYSCVYHDAQRRNTEQFCQNSVTVSQRWLDRIIIETARKWYVREMTENDHERNMEIKRRLEELPSKIRTLASSLERIEVRKKRIADDYEEMLIDREKRDARLKKVRESEVEMKDSLTRLEAEYERLTRQTTREMMTAYDATNRVAEMTKEELYAMVHQQISEIKMEIIENGKIISVHGFNSKCEKYRFEGQSRNFKFFRVFPDGSEINLTKTFLR